MNASLSRHTFKLSLSVEFVTIASASGLNLTRANPCSTFDLPGAAAAVEWGELHREPYSLHRCAHRLHRSAPHAWSSFEALSQALFL